MFSEVMYDRNEIIQMIEAIKGQKPKLHDFFLYEYASRFDTSSNERMQQCLIQNKHGSFTSL
jgi:hypothetical protein